MPILDDYIIDILLRDIVGHDRRPVAFLVYLWLAAESQRRHAPIQISYQELAESIGISKSSTQAAIAWLMARPAVSSVILGARSMDQLTDNMAAAELTLAPEETRLLDEASEPLAPDYPYGEPGQSQRSRRIEGGRF